MLEVTDLAIAAGGSLPVDGVSFGIARGTALVLAGGSGSGKSLTALAIMGLLPSEARCVRGRILLEGEGDLLAMPEARLSRLRGKRIALVFQEPALALDPLMAVGKQIREAVQAHEAISNREADARAIDALARLRFPDPERVLRLHPHQLSGGMRQRVLVAMASIHRPSVLIADEATSALDPETAEVIVDRLLDLLALGTAILFITHDLSLAARLSGRTVVMRGGRIVDPDDAYARLLVEAAR